MTTRKFLHAIVAHIEIALEYDPNDLAGLTTLNAQIRDQARKLSGYRDIRIALGKIPAPPAAIVEVAKDAAVVADDLTIPANLRR